MLLFACRLINSTMLEFITWLGKKWLDWRVNQSTRWKVEQSRPRPPVGTPIPPLIGLNLSSSWFWISERMMMMCTAVNGREKRGGLYEDVQKSFFFFFFSISGFCFPLYWIRLLHTGATLVWSLAAASHGSCNSFRCLLVRLMRVREIAHIRWCFYNP